MAQKFLTKYYCSRCNKEWQSATGVYDKKNRVWMFFCRTCDRLLKTKGLPFPIITKETKCLICNAPVLSGTNRIQLNGVRARAYLCVACHTRTYNREHQEERRKKLKGGKK